MTSIRILFLTLALLSSFFSAGVQESLHEFSHELSGASCPENSASHTTEHQEDSLEPSLDSFNECPFGALASSLKRFSSGASGEVKLDILSFVPLRNFPKIKYYIHNGPHFWISARGPPVAS